MSEAVERSLPQRLLREPLLHFVLLGAALFVLFAAVRGGDEPPPDAREIVVDAARIERLATRWEKVWQRPPTPTELDGLIEDHVREEVFYREAVAMGLDQDDTVVRRRMHQKLQFLSDDMAAGLDPTTEQLEAYLREHPDAFRVEARLDFRQVYFNRQQRGERTVADAEALLALLRAGDAVDLDQAGDRLMIPIEFKGVSEHDIDGRFGRGFAARLVGTPTGSWAGPVESGYGLHLVCIDARKEGRVPPLTEVRDIVDREWRQAQRETSGEAFYKKLRERYRVTVHTPPKQAEPQ